MIEPNRYEVRLALVPLGARLIEHHAAGDAAVEEQRQRDVAAGLAVLADQLDARPRRRRRRAVAVHTGLVGAEAEADAGERDVADAVAHQRQAALHEVDADGGRGQADQERRRAAPAA